MRRHSSNPPPSGTSMDMAGISPEWHTPANSSVHIPSALSTISNGSISSVCDAASSRSLGQNHEVKLNLKLSQFAPMPENGSGDFTCLGFKFLRFGARAANAARAAQLLRGDLHGL